MPAIVVTVNKDGSTMVSVNGVAGPSCQELTMAIEAALGAPAACELTPEFYQTAQEQAEVRQ